MGITIILVLFYILSVIYYYRFVSIVYSNKGQYPNDSPNGFEFIFMLIPIINTIMVVIMWSDSPYGKKYLKSKPKGPNLWDVIFNTKKIIITKEEKILIETYRQGYNDEIYEKPEKLELSDLDPLLFKIYKFGREDVWKQASDDQSDEEIALKIRSFLNK